MEEKRPRLPFRRPPQDHTTVVQSKAVKNAPLVNEMVNQPPSPTDPQGMYTGNPMDEREVPVQDADDL